MLEITLTIFIFLLGISIGSFLNVCIYRMGRQESIIKPASYCPHCKKPIRWYDNIPLLSYVLLKGRCRDCAQKISFRYFLVELLTGLIFLGLYRRFGLSPMAFSYFILVSSLIVATFVDFEFRIIPDEISLGGIVVGLILSFLIPSLHSVPTHLLGLRQSLIGVLVGGGVLWVLGCVGDFIFKKESMGGGDVKLLAMIGAFLGWKIALLSLPLASLVGSVVGVSIKLRTKESVIAFGPYLSLGALLGLFWSNKILSILFLY